MSTKRRHFKRPYGELNYRKLFVIAVEGHKTEPQYFAIFNNQSSVVSVNCLRGRAESSPPHVLKRMKEYLKNKSLKNSDEAWLVVDRDHWTEEQLIQLHSWSQESQNYGFALSNPNFEFWLLLHFEDVSRITTSRECSEHLIRYIPNYDKGIDPRKFTRESVAEAVQRARRRDNPPCTDWPRYFGTTVYRLVERLISNYT
jgi:hypothetical protein